jgi:hypothetical protein
MHFRHDILRWPKVGLAPGDMPPASGPVARWVDGRSLGVGGKGFAPNSSANFWQRLPDAAQATVPANIWRLSLQPAGVVVRFRSNASTVGVQVRRAVVWVVCL